MGWWGFAKREQFGRHGAGVTGLDPKELGEVQTFFLRLVGARGESRSRSVSLALHEDPTWKQGLAPALL